MRNLPQNLPKADAIFGRNFWQIPLRCCELPIAPAPFLLACPVSKTIFEFVIRCLQAILLLPLFLGIAVARPMTGMEFCTSQNDFCSPVEHSCCGSDEVTTNQESDCCVELPSLGDFFTAPATASVPGCSFQFLLPSDVLHSGLFRSSQRELAPPSIPELPPPPLRTGLAQRQVRLL
tara:strand:- start:6533 stop:7063 length:531 start_codon:yes stop_codon:yes gene_type:complete